MPRCCPGGRGLSRAHAAPELAQLRCDQGRLKSIPARAPTAPADMNSHGGSKRSRDPRAMRLIRAELIAGNIPEFLRCLVPISISDGGTPMAYRSKSLPTCSVAQADSVRAINAFTTDRLRHPNLSNGALRDSGFPSRPSCCKYARIAAAKTQYSCLVTCSQNQSKHPGTGVARPPSPTY